MNNKLFNYAHRNKKILRGGKIILQEEAPVHSKTDVLVTFLSENISSNDGKRIPGRLKGKVSLPDDFDAPLDDFKDYM